MTVVEQRCSDAAELCRRGLEASAKVGDAAYLFPYLITGTRALLALGDPGAAGAWVDEVAGALLARSIPGTLPAIDRARGLLQLAAGSTGVARSFLAAAHSGWQDRGRAWEAGWAAIDLAHCAYRSNRGAEAATLLAEAVARADPMGAIPLAKAAADFAGVVRRHGNTEPAWAPLSAREFEVAQLVAGGQTNREIADELHISAKTAASHIEHILAKLGARRRAEIATWVTASRSGDPLR